MNVNGGVLELQLLRNEELDEDTELDESSDAEEPARCLADSGHNKCSILIDLMMWNEFDN